MHLNITNNNNDSLTACIRNSGFSGKSKVSALRLSESLELRVKDIDFDYNQIIDRDAKGEKDRSAMLPQEIIKRTSVKSKYNSLK